MYTENELNALDGAYAVDRHSLTERIWRGLSWMTREDSSAGPREHGGKHGATWLQRPSGAQSRRRKRGF